MKQPLFITLTIAIIRDQRMRRIWMFYIVLTALVLLFAGSTFLAGALRQNVFWFSVFWLACLWLTCTAFLLAILDLLLLRSRARKERRELRRQVFGDQNDSRDDTNASDK
jgi:MFS family permease